MSYIGLFNETDLSGDTGTLDHMVINTVFSSMGSTLLNNTSLTGTLTGFTTIGEGETVFTYDSTTRTFTVSTPIGSISNGKLVYSTIILNGITMSLGGTYTLPISGTLPILYNSATGSISLNTTISQAQTFTSTATFSNGNNVQGAPYSAIFGALGSKSAQIVLYDALTYNSFAQLYCRSRNWGVQGNIDTISLEKATKIVTSLQITNVGLTANYCFIDSTGINISTGGSYKINGITVDTDDILEGTNKYYTTARCQVDARTALSVINTPELLVAYNNTTGVLTIPEITASSISNTKLQNSTIGLNGQSMSLGGTYTLSTVNITTTTLNQNYYLPLIDSLTAGNKIMYTDSNNGIMYNPAGNLMTVSQIEVINGVSIGLGNSYKINNVSIDTDDIQEATIPTNKYYTTARCQLDSRTAHSVVNTPELLVSYNSNTGVFTIPAITTASISNTKLQNSSISLNGTAMSLGSTYTLTTDNIQVVPLTGINKYLNSLTTGNTTEISHTYTGYNLTSNINPSSIALTKLTNGALGQLMICNALGNPVYSTISGDISNNSTGVMTIGTGAVNLTKINTSAYATANTVSTLVKRDATGNFSAGTITATSVKATITSTGQNVFGYGNNAQGVHYSAIFGTASSTLSGQIALIDGSSANQYAQLFCRNNIFGIQGNITSISLQKAVNITTGALSVLGGIINAGSSGGLDGVINIFSGVTVNYGTLLMDATGIFNIINNSMFSNDINIGTSITTLTTIGASVLKSLVVTTTALISTTLAITGLTSCNGGCKVGTNGTTVITQKFYRATGSVSGNSTSSYSLAITGFTAIPHVIGSIYNTGTPLNCTLICAASSTTNITYYVANSYISASSFTVEFMVVQY